MVLKPDTLLLLTATTLSSHSSVISLLPDCYLALMTNIHLRRLRRAFHKTRGHACHFFLVGYEAALLHLTLFKMPASHRFALDLYAEGEISATSKLKRRFIWWLFLEGRSDGVQLMHLMSFLGMECWPLTWLRGDLFSSDWQRFWRKKFKFLQKTAALSDILFTAVLIRLQISSVMCMRELWEETLLCFPNGYSHRSELNCLSKSSIWLHKWYIWTRLQSSNAKYGGMFSCAR